MNREQLAHVLRAAAQLADDPDIVVLGSQAILGTFDEDQLPSEITVSVEADLAFRDDPEERKSDTVDGSIGEGSMFHEMNAYYAQGVSISTAVLPAGWESRLVRYDRIDAAPSEAVCLDAHDLVISKLVAGRKKDTEFATALLAAELVDADVLHDRAGTLPLPGAAIRRVHDAISRCSGTATKA